MAIAPPAADAIAVVPSSLAGAAGASAALAAQVSSVSLRAASAGAIANPQCLQAFSTADQLVNEALHATVAALDQITRALQSASEAYGLADLLAVAPVTG